MDFGGLPPEINSARIYAGPGSESMLAAASAWDGLANELRSAASSYGSVIASLTDDSWVGPSAAAMEDSAAPYVDWLNTAAAGAEQTAAQAHSAASAYQTALASVVPPEVITANRMQLAQLMATNIYGQNTPAIASVEAQYGDMWAQDAAAMYNYAGNSTAASNLTAFTTPPTTTNAAGTTNQTAAAAQAASTSTGSTVQSTLSQLMSSIQSALQSLVSPSSSATSSSGLSSILSNLLGSTSSATGTTTTSTGLGSILSSSGFSVGGLAESLIAEYADLVGFVGVFAGLDAVLPLLTAYQAPLNTAAVAAAMPPVAAAVAPAAAAAGAAGGAAAALGPSMSGGFGGLAGLGAGSSVGMLSVPPSWGWAATPPLLGHLQVASPLPGPAAESGLPVGIPFLPSGAGQAAGIAAAAGVGGAVASKYGPRLKVLSRSPEAGYSPTPMAPAGAYGVPAGLPPAPGYTPHIVYLPNNGHNGHNGYGGHNGHNGHNGYGGHNGHNGHN